MRLARTWIAAAGLALHAAFAQAQQAEPATWQPARDARFWAASALLVAAALPFDRALRDVALEHRSRAADAVASGVDPLGRAHDLLPALAAGVILPRALGRRGVSDAAARVALSYLVSDAVESVLKPTVGRHRPTDGRGPLRFHPFASTDAWHSFPSAHVSHAFAIAAGVAGETRRPWIAAAAYGAAGLVGVQRVYRDAHWSSDVLASAALAVATASSVDAQLRRRGLAHVLGPARLGWLPGGAVLQWRF